MDKIRAGARRDRLLEIERLYRSGLTMRQIGEAMRPPISQVRVGQLLREGERFGLYHVERHHERESRNERRLTDIEVRAVLMGTQRKEQAAKELGISKAALESRFGHVLRGVEDERHRERRRRAIREDYAGAAKRLGFNPGAVDMPRPLAARIYRWYGSLRKFYVAEGVVPRDRRRTK